MSRILVSISTTLDGFSAGPDQSLDNPLGVGGMGMHEWIFGTKTFQKMFGKAEGEDGADEDFAARYFKNIGTTVMGRNMFGPVRGPWPDHSWKGWWGPNPPYHTPVFVLTHFDRPPLEMEGGTTFYFVTDGLPSALKKAEETAKGKDIRIGGGVQVIRECLKLGVVDEMHLAVSPLLLGTGEDLLGGFDLKKMGYQCTEYVPSAKAAHVVLTRSIK